MYKRETETSANSSDILEMEMYILLKIRSTY